MTKKIAKFAIISFLFLFAFLPIAFMADEAAPQPIFQGGDNSEKKGVAGIECALVSSPAEQALCFQCVKEGKSDCAKDYTKSGIASTGSVRELVIKYVNFALPLLALAAFTGFVYAGFLYVTAYGAEEQIGKAKKVMTYAVIGLVLVILSFSIVQLLTSTLVTSLNK